MERLVFRKKARDLTEAESILTDYPLSAEEELDLVPYVEHLLYEEKEIPESSEELLEEFRKWDGRL